MAQKTKFKGTFSRFIEFALVTQLEGEDGTRRESVRLPAQAFHNIGLNEGDQIEFLAEFSANNWIIHPSNVGKLDQ